MIPASHLQSPADLQAANADGQDAATAPAASELATYRSETHA